MLMQQNVIATYCWLAGWLAGVTTVQLLADT
jgi:hypothetical protein